MLRTSSNTPSWIKFLVTFAAILTFALLVFGYHELRIAQPRKEAVQIAQEGPYRVIKMTLAPAYGLNIGEDVLLELHGSTKDARLCVPYRLRAEYHDVRLGDTIGFGIKNTTIPPNGYIPDTPASYLLPIIQTKTAETEGQRN